MIITNQNTSHPWHFTSIFSLALRPANWVHIHYFCPCRLFARRHFGRHQFPAGGGSRWRLWHECSYHLLHVPGAAGAPAGQPSDWMGLRQPAYITGQSACSVINKLSVWHTPTYTQSVSHSSLRVCVDKVNEQATAKCLCLLLAIWQMCTTRGIACGEATEKQDGSRLIQAKQINTNRP